MGLDRLWLVTFAGSIGFGEQPTWGVATGAAIMAVGGIRLAPIKTTAERAGEHVGGVTHGPQSGRLRIGKAGLRLMMVSR
ncbi:hypothetical protein J2X65_000476 [Ancylobacter sp. 3268]|uniref:hypothetical protein n=1 Tax=Ancylobacter sp. 3268 TaxID=2817752 RepID=UPI002859FDA7|nr:hypothetical protein [Ancylobacter sp. 3268]MDR6951128.1 hypothetical protein [Ancylobacter sp. 3268]